MPLNSLHSAVTGMEAQQSRINNIANNLANVNTTGFKADRASFEDLMYHQVQTPGVENAEGVVAPVGVQVGTGTRLVAVYKNFSQGDLTQTNRELDATIEGNGFFEVTLENGGAAYTRDGTFQMNADGALVTNEGLELAAGITVPANTTSISIARDGTVTATVSGEAAPNNLGQLTLATFTNPAGLKSLGRNLYQETDGSGAPTEATPGEDGAGYLLQGFLEGSNVNLAEELIQMIIAQRSYESNSKVLTTASEMMRSTNNII